MSESGRRVIQAAARSGVSLAWIPLPAEIMANPGFAQRFGSGIPLVREELARNGNPEPEFAFGPSRVTVTVRPAS